MKASKRKPYIVEMTPAPIKYVDLQVKEIATKHMPNGDVAFIFKFTTGATFKQITADLSYDYWNEVKVGDVITACVRGPKIKSIHRC